MPFRRHDARPRAQAGGVHMSNSSASLSSFSSSSGSSILPVAPPSNSSQSDIATSDQSVHTSPSGALKSHLPPDTILPVPRSSSLIPLMGQIPSRSQFQHTVPPPSPTVPTSSGSAGSRLKRVFGGRRKKSEDILSNVAPTLVQIPMGMGKSLSAMTPASSVTPSSSAPKLPQHPSVSAGPACPTLPFTRHISAELPSVLPSKPSPEAILPVDLSFDPPPSPSDQRSSLMIATPGISAALQYASENEYTEDVWSAIRRPKKRDSDHEVMKEDWRKSDSTTTSYYTVRPRSGASGGTRTPRPVSMAESLQSTNTVVPAGKRLSALVTEAEFVMTEEDVTPSCATPLSRKTSPSGSSKTRKRHSISLSFSSPLSSNQPATSASASEGHEGHSSRPAFKHRPSGDVATLNKAAANGIIGPSHGGDSHSAGSHIRGNLATWSPATSTPPSAFGMLPQQPPPSPSQHGSLRQTAISMTSGLAPAAGFAMGFGKRAVERMGRAFGSLGSSHSSSGHSSPSSSIAGADRQGQARRTPNAPSGTGSINTIGSTSTGQTDPESFVFTGPILGTCLRGPMQNGSGAPVAGGLVFGRDLEACVHETAIDAIRLASPTSAVSRTVSPVLHERRLPALVVRCAQHLMKWGVEEEGLFRISGRATHVAKLRSEFDTGADFDIIESTPGDLDPHAVASIFKTYLRELPEPILTHALNPYFEVAMLTETNVRKSIEEQAAPVRKLGGKGPSLPSGPRDVSALRKPPSLTTLALPNFSGMRPPSQALLNAFASLLARLPQENRDLLRTRKEIRMPLSNLTVILCPTLNMSPPILRVLCEADGIWDGPPEGWEDSMDFDMERDVLNIAPDSQSRGDRLEQDSITEPRLPQSDFDQSSLMEPTWDTQVEAQVPSRAEDEVNGPGLDDHASYLSATDSRPSTPAWGKGSPLDPWSPPALTSSSDSLTTPSMSSEAPSIPQMTAPTSLNTYHTKDNLVSTIIPDFVRASPVPSSQSPTLVPVKFPRSETEPGTPSSLGIPLTFHPFLCCRRSPVRRISGRQGSSRLFSSSSSSSPYFDARDSPSRSTPASPRTPGSISPIIISAPSLLPRRSSSSLPPLLTTSIDSSSLSLAIGLDAGQPSETERTSSSPHAFATRESSPSPQTVDALVRSSSVSPITPVTTEFKDKSELPKLPLSQPEPLQPQLSDDSFVSVSSTESYHRLSLWENEAGKGALPDDWARNVLNDLGWSPTTVAHSMSGSA
ncbi:hypothetical protein B0F90DRAFT_1815135 [Multifurca ochricompacta]|uniref:Rho-GAP domain-containing protein n=1 Tax=Multifurca ochricompacta TaxID=376703 RepID=A0AAD4M837_9AGAM|nr:hypothetical protein B0F90DRAFT_1815135 [Multifurca ochricompacta]